VKRLGLVKDDAHNLDKWRSLTTVIRPTLSQYGNEGVILYRFNSWMSSIKSSLRKNCYYSITI